MRLLYGTITILNSYTYYLMLVKKCGMGSSQVNQNDSLRTYHSRGKESGFQRIEVCRKLLEKEGETPSRTCR